MFKTLHKLRLLRHTSGATKRPEATGVDWHIPMRPGKRKQQKHTRWGALTEQAEKTKASVRAKGEHPFRFIQRQFGLNRPGF